MMVEAGLGTALHPGLRTMGNAIALERPPVAPAERPATSVPSPRYHALDCVRAAAMLLGVVYHLQFMQMGGFGAWGMGGATNPKAAVDAWLHSFRMPLFFLISGFFSNMMLGKYGAWKYLTRRWWRIGAPLLVAFIAFGLLRTYFPGVTSAFGDFAAAPPVQMGALPSPFAGPGAPGAFGGFPPPTTGPALGAPPFQFGPPGQTPVAFPAFPMPVIPSHTWLDAILRPLNAAQDWVFGRAPWISAAITAVGGQARHLSSRFFNFEHLWFLWYLLVFVTVAPLLSGPLGRAPASALASIDGAGRWLVKVDLAALVLGLLAVPAVIHGAGFDWTFENPAGFLATLPDCLVQYYTDFPLYFLYFIAGWWFFRLRDALPHIGKHWLRNLAVGIGAFAISRAIFGAHGMQADGPHYHSCRMVAIALYAVGAAYSAMGLLGLFQRYFDRQTAFGKYFAETMLWVYLVHLAIIPHVLPWIQSERTAWWEATIAGVVVVTAIALAMFELFIRPTPLVRIFGPASLTRGQSG
jgi:surface polysaccharide O-acyltransferase-like enzyme